MKGTALLLFQQATSQGYAAYWSSPLYSPPEEVLLMVNLRLCPQHPTLLLQSVLPGHVSAPRGAPNVKGKSTPRGASGNVGGIFGCHMWGAGAAGI